MSRELPPITEPVTRAELMNILYREIYSARDILNEDNIRKLFKVIGIDYDKARTEAEANPMTDAEIIRLLYA